MTKKYSLLLWKRRRLRYYRFKYSEIPDRLKYFENKKNILIVVISSFIVTSSAFFFFDKEFATKIAAFAFLFSIYKIFCALRIPILKLDKVGIHLQNVRFNWSQIKKVKVNWRTNSLIFNIQLLNGKNVEEKIENFPIYNVISVRQNVNAFRKKYRTPYQFKKNEKSLIIN